MINSSKMLSRSSVDSKNLPFTITPREKEYLILSHDEGLTNKEIAERLFISEYTAKGLAESIRDKFNETSLKKVECKLRKLGYFGNP